MKYRSQRPITDRIKRRKKEEGFCCGKPVNVVRTEFFRGHAKCLQVKIKLSLRSTNRINKSFLFFKTYIYKCRTKSKFCY